MDRSNKTGIVLIITLAVLQAFVQGQDENSVEVLTYLRPNRSIEMSAIESGVIRSIEVKEGDEVAAGQALVHLNAETIEARLRVAQAEASNTGEVQGAEAEFKLNQSRYEIVQALVEKGTANEAEAERMAADLKISEGSLIAAQARLETARLLVKQIQAELDQRVLRSPIKGTVVEILKDVGESVARTDADSDGHLVRIVELDKLKAQAHVPFLATRSLKVGGKIPVRLEDGNDTLSEGTIQYISPVVDAATKTVTVHLIFNNKDRSLTSGVPAKLLLKQ